MLRLGSGVCDFDAQTIHVELERAYGLKKTVESSFDDPEPDKQCNDDHFQHGGIVERKRGFSEALSTLLDDTWAATPEL